MKKISTPLLKTVLTLLLSLLVALSAVIPCIAQTTPKGDLDNDGLVNSADFVVMRQCLLNETTEYYDLNGDGAFDIKDLVKLKKIALDFVEGEKFTVDPMVYQLNNATTYRLDQLFILEDKYTVNSAEVQVDIYSPSLETYTFNQDFENWGNSTISFVGTGMIEIKIWEFCSPTSYTFEVMDADKFNVKDDAPTFVECTKTYKLGDFFQSNEFEINSSKVMVEIMGGDYIFNQDFEDWTQSTLCFNYTGYVTVNICENSSVETYSFDVMPADKFKPTDLTEVADGTTVTIDKLFTVNEGFKVNPQNVQIYVYGMMSNSAHYYIDYENFENSTVKFTGTGMVTVEISEYSVANTARIDINVTPVDKFIVNPNISTDENGVYHIPDFSYIRLGELFADNPDNDAFVDSMQLMVEIMTAEGQEYMLMNPASNWEEYSIQLRGTGNALITIYQDCNPAQITVCADPIDKFSPTNNDMPRYVGQTVYLNELFTNNPNISSMDIDGSELKVTVNGEEYPLTDTYNWEANYITLDKAGDYTVTIEADSNPATATFYVNLAQKFYPMYPGYTIYVGEPVKLGDLFSEMSGSFYPINSQNVVVKINDQEIKLTDTANWAENVIYFDKAEEYIVYIEEKGQSEVCSNTVFVYLMEKFTVNDLSGVEIYVDEPVKLGTLFSEIEGTNVNDGNILLTVRNGNIANTDTTDWTQTEIIFTKEGNASVTISEGLKTTEVSVTVSVIKRPSVDKFAVKFTNTEDYLYRVGNMNSVSLGSLFKSIDNVSIGKVSVDFETIKGNATSTYTPNDTWTNGAIKFEGTGVVNITISDDNFSIPVTLPVEVVNAKNVTTYSELTNSSCVLLNDITMSNGGKYSLYDYATLYGNGFSFDVTAGQDHDTAGGSVGDNGTVWVRNSTLDNVEIIGEVYTQYGGTVKSEYNFPTVLVLGNSVIANSRITNGCSPVRVGSGCNIEIINSTLEGGIFANLDIRGGTVKLKDVTTINQSTTDGKSISNDKGIVGLGIVIQSGSTVTIDAEGLTQYNCISNNTTFSTSETKALKNVIFGSGYKDYQFSYDGATWVNTGIISMVAEVKGDNIAKIDGYSGKDASISGYNGYVYAPTELSSVSIPNEYVSSAQYQVAPVGKFDYTTKNNVPQIAGDNNYCFYDEPSTKYLISFDKGESFVWDADILTVTKNGNKLNPSISVSGGLTVNADNTIKFDTAGDYVVTYTYIDNDNYRLNNGKIEQYNASYEKKIRITVYAVEDTSAKTEFTFGTNGYRTETANNLTYVMPDVNATVNSNTNGIRKTTVGGVDIYYPVVSMHKSGTNSWYNYFSVFEAVTITDLDGTVYNTSSESLPTGLTVIGGFILKADGTVSSKESENGTSIFNYSTGKEIKCKAYSSYGLCYYPDSQFSKTGTSSRDEQTIVVKYRYTDSNGTPYYYYVGYWCEAHTKSDTCITPDTLITLADGSQVRVDELTGKETLLVWNHETGKLDTAPVAYIVNHNGDVVEREIIHLNFANGKTVKIIGEHVFFDATLNQYVAIDTDNADGFINHTFVALNADGTTIEKVKLVSVERTVEETVTYEIVSYKHLICFTEGILSTSAYLDSLLNIFDINADTMAYTSESVQKDIATYGLYTYADFEGLISEDAFELYNAKYLKIAVGKGYITWDDILALIDIYFDVDVQPIK